MKTSFLSFVLLLFCSFALYSGAGAFHFDDFALLLENPRVTSPAFRYESFLEHYGGRPLTLWTFYWNYRLFGENPFSYHLVSVVLHGLAAGMVFLLLLQLFHNRFVAVTAALLFAVHPLQTQAVNYIWCRSVLLMSCFGLPALLLVKRHPWAALGCLQLAVWSRTEAVVLAVPLLVLRKDQWPRMAVLAGLNLTGFVYSLFRYAPQEVAWNHTDPLGYWMAQAVAFWRYLRLIVWPAGLHADHDFRVPGVWIALIAALAAVALLALTLRWRRESGVAVLGVLWFATMLAPSLLIPNSDLFSESRSYLALAGPALIAAWILSRLPRRRVVVVSLIAWLAFLSAQRNEVWKDDLALWQDAARKSPPKARVRYNLGAALARRGAVGPAEKEFALARALNPRDDLSYAALGYCAEKQEDRERARSLYRKALRLNSRNGYARQALARLGEGDL